VPSSATVRSFASHTLCTRSHACITVDPKVHLCPNGASLSHLNDSCSLRPADRLIACRRMNRGQSDADARVQTSDGDADARCRRAGRRRCLDSQCIRAHSFCERRPTEHRRPVRERCLGDHRSRRAGRCGGRRRRPPQRAPRKHRAGGAVDSAPVSIGGGLILFLARWWRRTRSVGAGIDRDATRGHPAGDRRRLIDHHAGGLGHPPGGSDARDRGDGEPHRAAGSRRHARLHDAAHRAAAARRRCRAVRWSIPPHVI
jgi:hypothetical protein